MVNDWKKWRAPVVASPLPSLARHERYFKDLANLRAPCGAGQPSRDEQGTGARERRQCPAPGNPETSRRLRGQHTIHAPELAAGIQQATAVEWIELAAQVVLIEAAQLALQRIAIGERPLPLHRRHFLGGPRK